MAGLFSNFRGTSLGAFLLGIGGALLKNSSGNLLVRNAADNADAEITAAKANISGDTIDLNSDAANTAGDRKYTFGRPSSGMSAAQTFLLPPTSGSDGQVLKTDGSGNTSWVSAGNTAPCETDDTTTLAFGDSSPVAMFNLPANAVIKKIQVIIDTQFNGTPTVSIGITGTTSKYMPSTEIDLTAAAGNIFERAPGVAASGSGESIIATYSAGGASAGSCRIIVTYSIPA